MHLPKPPCGDEIYLFEETDKPRLFSWAILSYGTLLLGMLMLAQAHAYFWLYSVIGCLAISYLLMSYLIGLVGESNMPLAFKPLTRRPTVDVYYTICGEPLEVCENALGYIMKMQRAYGDEATVYVLDDSLATMGLALVEKFKPEGRIVHLRRHDPGQDKKAGNLRYAFARTSGEFIANFDADFCPVEDYLDKLLPFLLEDERLAILQTPQFFTVEDHVSWVGRGSANVQELFYRLIQVSRNSFNAAICVGSCAVYRRRALEPFGGSALVHYSEDMRTGFNCLRLGWSIRYIPYNLAKGLCPDDLNGFINQQYRWSLGSMSLCFTREFWSTPLSFMQRFCYLSGMFYYIITGLALFLTFVPITLILIFAPDLAHWYNVFFTIPSLIYCTWIYSHWSKTTWGLHTPRSMQVTFYCHLLALVDYLRGRLVPWEATGAVKGRRLYARYRALVIFRTWVYALFLAGLMCYRLPQVGWVNLIPTALLLIIEVMLNQSVQQGGFAQPSRS